jgi:hypothetical protein
MISAKMMKIRTGIGTWSIRILTALGKMLMTMAATKDITVCAGMVPGQVTEGKATR